MKFPISATDAVALSQEHYLAFLSERGLADTPEVEAAFSCGWHTGANMAVDQYRALIEIEIAKAGRNAG